MRLSSVVAQPVQHRCERQSDRASERERCQRIECVVPAPDAQGVDRHQPMHVDLGRRAGQIAGRLAAPCRQARILGPRKPGHAGVADQPERLGLRRGVGAECDHGRLAPSHRGDDGIVTVQHAHSGRRKDAFLRLDIGLHRAVPVEMILRDVEHSCCIAGETRGRVQLEARQFEHPHVRKIVGIESRRQFVECRGGNVAGNGHAPAAALGQQASEPRRGRLAVGPGHAEHPRRVGTLLSEPCEFTREQFDFAHQFQPARAHHLQQRRDARMSR